MKYLVVIGNGLTDQPIAEKDNKTILQLADIPNLDRLAKEGRTGSVQTIPQNCCPGNDVSFLSLLGYDPEKYHAGPAEFVAVGLGVSLNEDEIPLCCDFISLQASHNDMVMKDYTAGQLSGEDARILLDALQTQTVDSQVTFHPGKGYHNLMVLKSPPFPNRLAPPDELIGEGIRQHMPAGKSTKVLVSIINQAQIILHNHSFNKKRREEGQDPVNSIWLWGNGARPSLPSFTGKYRLNGSIITASLLLQGMGKSAGLKVVPVEGATGFMDTNYQGKVAAALKELEKQDVVYLQISAPERVSLQGLVDDKITAVEDFDQRVVGKLLEAIEGRKDVKILLAVNQMCSANLMKFTRDPVPFVIYPARKGSDSIQQFDEEIVRSGSEHFQTGPALMDALFKEEL